MRSSVIHKAQRERTHQGVHDEWSLRSECRLTSAGWFYTPSPGMTLAAARRAARLAGTAWTDHTHRGTGWRRLPYPPRDGLEEASIPTEGRGRRKLPSHGGMGRTRLPRPRPYNIRLGEVYVIVAVLDSGILDFIFF